VQVSQLLVDPHPGRLELSVRAPAQSNDVFETVAGIVDTDLMPRPSTFHSFQSVRTACISSKRPRRRCSSFLSAARFFGVDTEIRAETADAAAERYRNTLAGAGWRRKFARGRA